MGERIVLIKIQNEKLFAICNGKGGKKYFTSGYEAHFFIYSSVGCNFKLYALSVIWFHPFISKIFVTVQLLKKNSIVIENTLYVFLQFNPTLGLSTLSNSC